MAGKIAEFVGTWLMGNLRT